MANNIDVQPGERPGKQSVATVEIGGVHYPVYLLGDENQNIAAVDQYSKSLQTIETEHYQIHNGNGYSLSGKTTIADTATLYLVASNTNGTPVHWRTANVHVSGGEVDLYFYEAPTYTGGSATSVYNKNRMSSNTSNLDILTGANVTDNGTELEYGFIPDSSSGGAGGGPGGGGGSPGGGEANRIGGEWILAPETDYLIAVTNNSGASITAGYAFFWYELA